MMKSMKSMKAPIPKVMPNSEICSSVSPNIDGLIPDQILRRRQIGRDAHAQRVEFDEAGGVLLVVGAGIVLEGGDGRVEQRIGFRIAADDDDVALVKLDPHPAIDRLLGVIDQRLQGEPLRAPPVAVVDQAGVARHQVVLEMGDFAVQGDRLDRPVRRQQDGAAGVS
jgi:hypothetical protein